MNRTVLIALGLSLFGIMMMDFMGVLIRILSPNYSAQQLSIYRNLFGMIPCTLLLLFYMRTEQQPILIRQWPLAFFRGFCVTFAQVCYYLSLTKLEFATATTLAYCGPMIITCLAAMLLSESVGIWRWGAVLIGFAGIIMVMGPGTDVFTWAAILPVGAAFGYALSIVLVRLIDDEVSTSVMILYSSFSAFVGSLIVTAATSGYTPVQPQHWPQIAAMGLIGGTGVIFLVQAYRMASPSILAPFDYFGLVFAFVLGWYFFNEAPIDRLFPGVLLIVAGGLIIVWREGRAKANPPKTDIV